MTTAEIDVLETLGRPEYPAAVQWSEDNLLAVAAGSAVLIVNPCQVRGPRGSTVLPEPSMNVLQVDQYPVTPKDSVTYASTYLRTRGLCSQRNSQLASSKLGIRSVSWSPLGCDLPGNALLASVTENHQANDVQTLLLTTCLAFWLTYCTLSDKHLYHTGACACFPCGLSNSVAHSHRAVQQVEADFSGRKLAGMPQMLQCSSLSMTPRHLVNKHSPPRFLCTAVS